MEYDFQQIEAKWQKYWADNKTYMASDDMSLPKHYQLSMFPYPSGAGLHVGHPLGYIASCIYARYKKLHGFNVLHPMGYDSFGLPAEQYAIETGQHPVLTTKKNIARYRAQLDKIGFSFDWEREVRTSDPSYYKWTQWIFKQLYNSWYNKTVEKAEPITQLVLHFLEKGSLGLNGATSQSAEFTADDWKGFSEEEKQGILMNYRLTFLADSWVNWCPALGTVLANDEIKDGVSERGGHPVERKLMRQWSMRITAYAERLINDLDTVDWTDSIKDQQRNWIGKSVGASVHFEVEGHQVSLEVFTTRPDTIYGVSFIALAPEHNLVDVITTTDKANAIIAYKKRASLKTERDRQADVKHITGQFTGAHALHPFTKEKIQIWIADYVLVGYGTGAVMAVPCGDQRDWDFANHFKDQGLTIPNIFKGVDVSKKAYADKDSAVIANSDFLSNLPAKKAIKVAIFEIEKRGFGKGQTNYKLRDAVFSRQRFWGEPFPIYYKKNIPYLIDDEELPIILPEVDKYLPTEDGEPPLARAKREDWETSEGYRMEYNTMPGWAGSSWYFLRYMDPNNQTSFVSKERADYWNQVDLYIGGSEHATGHLLYARFWTQFLYDQGYINFREPFKKMINQGMILGNSAFVYRLIGFEDKYVHKTLYDRFQNPKTMEEAISEIRRFAERDKITVQLQQIHVDISYLNHEDDSLDIEGLKANHPSFSNADFQLINGHYICGREVEKMSKSKYNVQTPDELIKKFGADTLRCYEMFLGPFEQTKPWDTKGINGVHNFLRKLWRLFHNDANEFVISDDEPHKKALKILHKTIKRIKEDLDRFSFNTAVSNFMIAVNALTDQKCNNRSILKELIILVSPYAPHIAEELWEKLGEEDSVTLATFPTFNPDHLLESEFAYPVSFNGKMRFKLALPTGLSKEDIEKEVLAARESQKWLEGRTPERIIVVPGKIVNVVI